MTKAAIERLPEVNFSFKALDEFQRAQYAKPYRRKDFGRMLFARAREEAQVRGASALYASACDAKETIDFDRAMLLRR